MAKRKTWPQAKHTGGCMTLAANDVWNIPESDTPGDITHSGFPFASITGYRALAKDGDGFIYGIRKMYRVRESGYELEGRVKIDGKEYRAFTSHTLFQRDDGKLVNVAVIYVCKPDGPVPLPDLDKASNEVLQELAYKYHYSRNDSRQLIHDYARTLLLIREGAAEQYPHCRYRERLEEIYAELPEWSKFRGRS